MQAFTTLLVPECFFQINFFDKLYGTCVRIIMTEIPSVEVTEVYRLQYHCNRAVLDIGH